MNDSDSEQLIQRVIRGAGHAEHSGHNYTSGIFKLLWSQSAALFIAALVLGSYAHSDRNSIENVVMSSAAVFAALLGCIAAVAASKVSHLRARVDAAARSAAADEIDASTQQSIAESERRFRHLFENACEGIFQSTVEGRYLRVNPALARMYGFASPEAMMDELTDISRSLYVRPDRRAEFIAHMLSEGMVESFESEIFRKDGSTIWISESARCVRDSDATVLYFEGFVENISARKQLEQDREAMLAEAIERANRDPLTSLLNHRAFHKRVEEESERAQRTGSSFAVAVLDMDNFKFFNDAYGHAAGDAVLNQVAANLRTCCRSYDVVARFGGDEFAVLMPDADPSLVQEFPRRVRTIMETSGFRPEGYDANIPLGVSIGLAVYPSEVETRHDLLELADLRLRRAKLGSDEESFGERLRTGYVGAMSGFKTLDALVTAVDNKDRYTRRHSEDVVLYSTMIARELGLNEQLVDEIQLTALLHDVGKIGVPDNILRKPGALDEEEYEFVKQHAVMGAMIVSSVPGFACTIEGIRHHHERWDGMGYPDMIAGEQIPVVARILAVADAFSAMTTNRPYRAGMPAARAIEVLQSGSGSQWEPRCIEAFLSAYARQESGIMAAA